MLRNRTLMAWVLGLAGAVTFLIGASATEVVRAKQDPPPQQQQEPPAQEPGRGGRGAQAAGAAAVRAGHHERGRRPTTASSRCIAAWSDGHDSYFEIPKGELDKDFVWNVAIKKTTIGAGFGGQNVSSRVVRWVKRGDRILLQGVDYSITPTADDVVAQAVADANYPAIIRTLPVAAYGPERRSGRRRDGARDGAGVAAEFGGGGGVPEFSARAPSAAAAWTRPARSSNARCRFPENINIEATLTFTGGAGGAGGGGGGGRRRRRRRHARSERHRARAPQPDEAAGEADDAAPLRRARRLRHR